MTIKRSSSLSGAARSRKSVTKTRQYRSKIAEAVHKTAHDFYRAAVLSKRSMREFDESCLTPLKSFAARDIEKLRKREEASQAVFAHHLGVSVGLISQWERGEKRPQGASLKLLTLVDKNGLDWVA